MSRVLRVVARVFTRPTGLEGWKSLGHEKIAAGPQQPRSPVLRGERAGYVNNPPRLQLEYLSKGITKIDFKIAKSDFKNLDFE